MSLTIWLPYITKYHIPAGAGIKKEVYNVYKCGVCDSLTMSISLIGTSESTCMEIFISLGEPVNEVTK